MGGEEAEMKLSRSLVACCIGAVLWASCTSTPKRATAAQSTPISSPTETPSVAGTPTKTPLPPKLPSGFVVVDSSWISDRAGWVLGGRGCEHSGCSIIVRTIDGGGHWTTVAAPRAFVPAKRAFPRLGCPPADCVEHIRFATSRIGFAFGPSSFETTDGGRSWHKEAGLVSDVEISSGRMFRLAFPNTGCPGPCDVHVESASIGSTEWKRAPLPATSGVRFALALEGSHVYFVQYGNPVGGANDAHTSFSRSTDSGKTWANFEDPCGSGPRGEDDTIDVATSPGGGFIILCEARLSPETALFLRRSGDGGAAFGPRRSIPIPKGQGVQHISAGNFTTIAVSFMGDGPASLMMSRDGGSTWTRSLNAEGAGTNEQLGGFLGFEDARTARAAFDTRYLWSTFDGGRTWRRSAPFAGL
jgi:hypothetical protein